MGVEQMLLYNDGAYSKMLHGVSDKNCYNDLTMFEGHRYNFMHCIIVTLYHIVI